MVRGVDGLAVPFQILFEEENGVGSGVLKGAQLAAVAGGELHQHPGRRGVSLTGRADQTFDDFMASLFQSLVGGGPQDNQTACGELFHLGLR